LKPFFAANGVTIYQGDSRELLRQLPDESVHCCVTSPPYWGLRDYGVGGQIGLESTPYEYISTMRMLFAEVRRVLRSDGTLWLNMGDCYAQGSKGNSGELRPTDKQYTNAGNHATRRGEKLGPNRNGGTNGFCKPKDLCGLPWMLAFALREDGWYLRSEIIWDKTNGMPESADDRPTRSHEQIFLLTKRHRYYFNADAIKERCAGTAHARGNGVNPKARTVGKNSRQNVDRDPRHIASRGCKQNASFSSSVRELVEFRNKRSVWHVSTQSVTEAHFATFPEDLIKPCILAGCPEGGTVLDPFGGAGTTGLVARKLHCKAILLELNPGYIEISARRLSQEVFNFEAVPGESGRDPV
jgi:DNA modification methylase